MFSKSQVSATNGDNSNGGNAVRARLQEASVTVDEAVVHDRLTEHIAFDNW